MGTSYHQFCPVAKAMELLDERWTLLIVRELVAGSERFNDLRRGVPRMSPTLLSKRLGQLVRAGVVDRRDDGGEVRYMLTPAGLTRAASDQHKHKQWQIINTPLPASRMDPIPLRPYGSHICFRRPNRARIPGTSKVIASSRTETRQFLPVAICTTAVTR
jgi:DNA-binding HxlR family transcriptional regulator